MEAPEGRANYTASKLPMSEEELHSAGIVSE
jgi:hypothetical protein